MVKKLTFVCQVKFLDKKLLRVASRHRVIDRMKLGQNLNLFVNRAVAERFREAVKAFDNRLGLCATAAMLMFLEADPRMQAKFIAQVQQSELTNQVETLLAEIRNAQLEAIKETDREKKPKRAK